MIGQVSVPDLLMVRTLMQMLIYTSYCLYRSGHERALTYGLERCFVTANNNNNNNNV